MVCVFLVSLVPLVVKMRGQHVTAAIDFYFDFSSPYGYFASERIDELAARYGRAVEWHPILLGVVFKVTGSAPLPELPLKGEYALRDIPRTARHLGIAYRPPAVFPIATVNAARGYYCLQQRDPRLARAFARVCYRAYFAEGIDISDSQRLAVFADSLGMDKDAFSAGLSDPTVKERLKKANDSALARGVFGSPFIIVDGEPFWGSDRLPQVEKWLQTRGF